MLGRILVDAVQEARERFIADNGEAPALVFEIPLLFETGGESAFDKVVALSHANVLATAYSRLRAEQRIRHQALHDPLTRLANRALCRDRLEHALAHAGRSGSHAAVLYVDVDDFKRVNDLYGHSTGDAVLVALARRLAGAVRPADAAPDPSGRDR